MYKKPYFKNKFYVDIQLQISWKICRHLCNNTGNCRYVKYDRTQLKCDLFGTEDDEFDVHCDNFYVVRSFKFSQVSDFQMSEKRICVSIADYLIKKT